ncbi:hypothetical protein GGTG_13719 [Gaeumannomyces tritici R3-111a-1]|uniref:Molybdate-anion transporter n=1 Tax=Gaeumannomyces tritici (strain R3-111a-1) TaxID=644352 RepID=J3PJN2_GAET3|nr:hypothetical protein GGTG_13719 [Gaeumannomyces tritici R3-111a-1]EJT68705.1 hypothetical protein GGTG_13719 [Gaeumannomyces tritici R3-111a-1]
MDIYQLNLAGLIGLCGVLFLAQRKSTTPATKDSKTKKDAKAEGAEGDGPSQWAFLVVFSLVMGSDWLQGPFLYSLYRDEHGVSAGLVSTLYTTGFLSGAAGGYVAGTLADRHGRRRACLLFCGVYAASCLLTASPSALASPPVLFAGRVLGGIGTSLLFSVFESWMVTDFAERGLAAKGGDLSRTFGLMSTLNSVVAIVSGVFSEWLVAATGTRRSPFYAAVVLLGVAAWVIVTRFDENYGQSANKAKTEAADKNKPQTIVDNTTKLSWILSDPKVLALGLASTMFEGSMYLFVFFWSPALNAARDADPAGTGTSGSGSGLPYGVIFAAFMATTLAASLAFNMVMERGLVRYSVLMIGILAAADLCFASLSGGGGMASSRSEQTTFWLFCAFEACVGVYWPCMGYLKGRLIEDGARARVYSVLRVPLNLFVVASLHLTRDGGPGAHAAVFGVCAKLLLASCAGLWAMVMNENDLP